jgi:hypothetical protein
VKVAEDKLVLYVGNIPQELTEDEVRSAIKQICTKITNEFNIEFRPCKFILILWSSSLSLTHSHTITCTITHTITHYHTLFHSWHFLCFFLC